VNAMIERFLHIVVERRGEDERVQVRMHDS
jgi:hypothetical protein